MKKVHTFFLLLFLALKLPFFFFEDYIFRQKREKEGGGNER